MLNPLDRGSTSTVSCKPSRFQNFGTRGWRRYFDQALLVRSRPGAGLFVRGRIGRHLSPQRLSLFRKTSKVTPAIYESGDMLLILKAVGIQGIWEVMSPIAGRQRSHATEGLDLTVSVWAVKLSGLTSMRKLSPCRQFCCEIWTNHLGASTLQPGRNCS